MRVVSSLKRKSEAGSGDVTKSKRGKRDGFNPFLPYEEKLYVQDMGEGHVVLLNKFNVVKDHVLIVTKRFEEQGELLNVGDMEGLWGCLREVDGVGFYNSGIEAGASQRHKHLQVICGRVGEEEWGEGVVPFDRVLSRAGKIGGGGDLFRVRELGYWHVGVGMEGVGGGKEWWERYMMLMGEVMRDERGGSGLQYNLIATRRWMVVVPRRKECWEGVSVNALGFTGCLLVKETAGMELLKRVGGMKVLREVAFAE